MKMRARVRATLWIEFAAPDAPEPETKAHPRARTANPGQVVTNAEAILTARAHAAAIAEKVAAERFPDAEILVEEVIDA